MWGSPGGTVHQGALQTRDAGRGHVGKGARAEMDLGHHFFLIMLVF